MRFQGLVAANYLAFAFVTLTLTSLQCSLWLQFFGYFPAPQMWLTTLAYWAIYRKSLEALIMTYIVTAIAGSLSAIPANILLIINILLLLVTLSIKQRIFWRNPTFIMLCAGIVTLLFPVLHFTFSLAFEPNPIEDLEVLDWILSALLTSLVSLPLYYLYNWIDVLTQKELPTEAGHSTYE